jgi:hypothetical protein
MASMKLVKKFDERDDEIFTMDEIYCIDEAEIG